MPGALVVSEQAGFHVEPKLPQVAEKPQAPVTAKLLMGVQGYWNI